MGSSRDKRRKNSKKARIELRKEFPQSIQKYKPKVEKPKVEKELFAYKTETPVWQLSEIDNDSKWGCSSLSVGIRKMVIKHLRDRETMTWAKIEQQTYGLKNKTSNHEIELDKLIPSAQKRLEQLKRDYLDTIFSLRVKGKFRVWGNRKGRVFQIFWFDLNHEICPAPKR